MNAIFNAFKVVKTEKKGRFDKCIGLRVQTKQLKLMGNNESNILAMNVIKQI